MANRKETNKKIDRAIRLVWSSLESHLYDTHSSYFKKLKSKIAKDALGDSLFHTKCVKEYAEVIKILTELLK